MMPAIARNAWLKKRGQTIPQFDYDGNSLLWGKTKLMAIFWIWQYRLVFWGRTGWRRRFLIKHPHLMERVGHFLYYFPSTIPGFTSMLRMSKFLVKWFGG
jgi:hypothetical protein